jgi:hypothetical protein
MFAIYFKGRFVGAVAGHARVPEEVFMATSRAAWALKEYHAASL